MSITPATYTEDAVNQLNQQGVDVVNPTILYQQRNLARRQYAGEYPWRWAEVNSTLTTTLDGTTGLYTVPLPATIDTRFPVTAWSTVSGVPTDWKQVSYRELFILNADPSYYLDVVNNKVQSNTSGTFTLNFQKAIVDLPNNTSQDAVVEPFPNATAITFLLASYYVLSTRQEIGTAQYFEDKYNAQLADDIEKAAEKIGVIDLTLPMKARR